jgi:hypothetical protein
MHPPLLMHRYCTLVGIDSPSAYTCTCRAGCTPLGASLCVCPNGAGFAMERLSGPYFMNIVDVSYAPNGDIVVLDNDFYRLKRFNPFGAYLSEFGSFGSAPGQFLKGPLDSAIDGDGNIYVAEVNTAVQRVQVRGAGGLAGAVMIRVTQQSVHHLCVTHGCGAPPSLPDMRAPFCHA